MTTTVEAALISVLEAQGGKIIAALKPIIQQEVQTLLKEAKTEVLTEMKLTLAKLEGKAEAEAKSLCPSCNIQ